jgi:large subunit ribosomal protein L19
LGRFLYLCASVLDRVMDALSFVQSQVQRVELPNFKAGDTVSVHYRIVEGDKERKQIFTGVVIQRRGTGTTETFTVRKISNGVGVERIFPLTSPFIEKVVVNVVGKVRRARLFYLRTAKGKKARVKAAKI